MNTLIKKYSNEFERLEARFGNNGSTKNEFIEHYLNLELEKLNLVSDKSDLTIEKIDLYLEALKELCNMNIVQSILDYTNERLVSWYEEAKESGVKGAAIAFLHNEQIVIDYVENGVTARFSLNHFEGEAIDYVFNVWSEEADLQVDKVS